MRPVRGDRPPAAQERPVSEAIRRGQVFRYESYAISPETGLLSCRYSVDGRQFEERFTLSPEGRWDSPLVPAAARLVFLLAGVSYYKTAAPPVIDLGDTALTSREQDFLRQFYLQGLGEFAYRNNLDLSDLRISAGLLPPAKGGRPPGPPGTSALPKPSLHPLIPFGGGIDSIV